MSTELAGKYPELAHLLGTYLHQDFDIYGPTLADAILAFSSDDGRDAVAAARADIALLLRDYAQRLDWALQTVEPGHAKPVGMDARAYLEWLDGVLGGALSTQEHAAE